MIKRFTQHFNRYLFILISILTFQNGNASAVFTGDLYYALDSSYLEASVLYNDVYKQYTEVIIPATVEYSGRVYRVTSIEDKAFKDCINLRELIIEDSNIMLTIAGGYDSTSYVYGPFKDCPLEKVYIGRTLSFNSRYSPFVDQQALSSVTIGNEVTFIGSGLFKGCSSLSEISIPNSVRYIEEGAFSGCSSLRQLTIEEGSTNLTLESNKSSSDRMFSDCPLEKVYIGRNLLYSKYPFYYLNTLFSVTISPEVTSIGNGLFMGCSSLSEISIPNSVTSIGDFAFSGCSSLSEIFIPNTVTFIGDDSFSGCSSLSEISIPNSVTSIGDGTFYGCSSLSEISIPNSVTSIGIQAFSECSALSQISIPNSVTSIGSSAFEDCFALSEVSIPNSVTSIGGDAFSGCKGLNKVYISDLTAWCKISFKSSDYIMGGIDESSNPLYYAKHLYLNDNLITDIVIPDDVSSIKDYTFCNGIDIASVSFHKSITSIGEKAFYGCDNLKKIVVEDFDNWCKIIGSSEMFSTRHEFYLNNKKLTTISIPDINYFDTNILSFCEVETLVIPNNVRIVGPDALQDCNIGTLNVETGEETLTLSYFSLRDSKINRFICNRNISSYNINSFYYGYNIGQLIIGENVTSIGANTFYRCFINSIFITSKSLLSLGEKAFYNSTIGDIIFITNRPPVDASSKTSSFNKFTAHLYIPEEMSILYYGTTPWSKFANISPITKSSSFSIGNTESVNLQKNESLNLEIKGITNFDGIWYSSDNNVVTVEDGLLKGHNIGTAEIYAINTDGTYASITINVEENNNAGIPIIEEDNELSNSSNRNVKALNLSGVIMYEGPEEEMVLEKGLYIILKGNKSQKVMIK